MRMTLGLPHPALSLLGVSPPSRAYFSYILAAFFHATTTHRVVCDSAFLTHDQQSASVLVHSGWFFRGEQGVIQGREQSSKPVQDNNATYSLLEGVSHPLEGSRQTTLILVYLLEYCGRHG